MKWERGKPPERVRQAHRAHVRCAAGPANRKALKRYWRKAKRAFFEHRQRKLAERAERRRLDALTPYGEYAIPTYIVMCESGGNFGALNPSGAGGAYQIIPSTWAAYGGLAYAPSAVSASEEAQHIVAGRIWSDVGASAWVCA